jgi:aminoglycoside N3'-acetyltransferase
METANQNYRIKKFENANENSAEPKRSYRYLMINPQQNSELIKKNREREKREHMKQVAGIDAT